ncbi:MAG: glycosyltransferase [Anaerolineae bacterium]|nr:glycosyltransferase [Anaerolineae bacterium]
MQKRLFIGWAPSNRRSQLLAEKLNAELHMISRLKHRSPLHAPLKYPWMAVDTWRLLRRTKPDVVFVQNPPPVLPLVVWFFSLFHSTSLVIDHHTKAFDIVWIWFLPVQKFLARWAKSNIVTNDHWKKTVEAWGGSAMILDDVPTDFPAGKPYPVKGRASVAVVSSFAPDEPLETVVKVAAELSDINFYITGDRKRAPKNLLAEMPNNVTLTGFLPDEDYFGLLRKVDAVMVLTTRNHTNQRGGCEAVWLGQPLITSDWPILRTLFNKGTVYVQNTEVGIKEGIDQALMNAPRLAQEMKQLQEFRRQNWQQVSHRLETVLQQ